MTTDSAPPPVPPVLQVSTPASALAGARGQDHGEAPAAAGSTSRWTGAFLALALLMAAVGVALAWQAQSRVGQLEKELVRRQQDLQALAAESRVLSKQAEDSAREAVAKASLLEAKVAEVAVQRGQLEDLIQSLSRSRDENLLVDIEAALRVAQQQASLTGSAEPLVTTLRQADERLARYNQPRLEGVRRAIARDIDRVRAVGVADVAQLVLRIDEIVRLADDIPLLAAVEQGRSTAAGADGSSPSSRRNEALGDGVPVPAGALDLAAWWAQFKAFAGALSSDVAQELRSLVRVSRVDRPEALLLAPNQAYFLRENLKLRLLSARLSLLSRQFDAARAELLGVQSMLERYFDKSSRKTGTAIDVVRQVANQSRQVPLPRPDDTLAAITTVAGR